MFTLSEIQQAIRDEGFDGWLLYDFRGVNVLAKRVLDIPDSKFLSRRWAYFVPATGTPRKLVHRIESGALDHLPGDKTIYLKWQEFEAGMDHLVGGAKRIAMEYSERNGNPYISRVDAGTVEIVRGTGSEIFSSGDLIQRFEAVWDEEQVATHYEAARGTNAAYDVAWQFIRDAIHRHGEVGEIDVQRRIMQHFADHDLLTYSPPIVGVNAHSGDPHYETTDGPDCVIREGDFVLIDLWAKLNKPRAVYSDLTRTGFVGTEVPEKYTKIFNIVAAARDAGIALARERFAARQPLQGWEIDAAVRKVIDDAGYGSYFVHRTGHNIGQEVHGNGAHMDNLETRETRKVMPGTCFSIEPGIYLPEFGVRSEIDVFVDKNGVVDVTGGPLQMAIVPILQ